MPPPGMRVLLDRTVRRRDGGRVLVGGSPLRLLRLSPKGADVVSELASGQPVGPSPGRRRLARRLLDGGLAHPAPANAGVAPSPGRPVAATADVGDAAGRPVIDALADAGDAAGRPVVAAADSADRARYPVVVAADTADPANRPVATAADAGESVGRAVKATADEGESVGRAVMATADVGDSAGQPVGSTAGVVDSGPPAAGAHGLADVTAVVPVYGNPAELARTLAALAADRSDGLEVVVVDDGSTAPAAAAIGEVARRFGVGLRRRPANGGPAAARNTGLAATQRPVVAFLDADTVPEPGWLTPLLDHLADPAVAAVAPRVRSTPVPPARAGRRRPRPAAGLLERYEQRHSPLDMGADPGRIAPRSRVTYVPSAALVARRAAVAPAGGFDEELRYGEDVDLVWRLVAAGGTVRYEPAVVVHHAPRPDWPAWLAQRFGYGTAAAPLARRHPGQVPPLAVSPWSLAAWGLLAAGLPVAAAGVAGASAVVLAAKLRRVLPHPAWDALRLAAWGHGQAGRWTARALTRPWWPLALVGAVLDRRVRRAVLAAALLPALTDWRPADGVGLLAHVGLRLLDDGAYGAGVWWGCVTQRSLAPLVPAVGRGPLDRTDDG